MALIHVKHSGRNPHCLQCAETAHAQQQFLPNAKPPVASVKTRRQFPVLRSISCHIGIQKQQVATANLHAPHFRVNKSATRLNLHVYGFAGNANRRLHRQFVRIRLQVLFLLPTILIELLTEISLAVKQADADQRNVEVRRTLDVVSRENAKPSRIHRNGFVQPKLGREISDRPGTQNPGMSGAPGSIRVEVLALAPVRIVDAAVQDEFGGAPLDCFERDLCEESDWVVVELPPSEGIEIEEQIAGILIPAPPEISSQRPQAFLSGSNEAVESSRLADDGRHLCCGLREHANFVVEKRPRGHRLNDENALQDAPINQRDSQERLIRLFAGLTEILEARMILDLLYGNRPHLFCNEPREAFMQAHPKCADTLRPKAKSSRQHEVRSVRLQQVGGTDIRLKSASYQLD